MTTRAMTRRQLSRSKIELYLDCPRCFYDEVMLGIARPSGPPFTLNIAVDALFKTEFDTYRAQGKPHPLFATVGLDAVPMQHPQLEAWRSNFTGIRWKDPETDWTFFGAVDDLWVRPNGAVVVADYKATAKAEAITPENIFSGYKRQLEMYQFLVEKAGFTVDARAWLVYANGIKTAAAFDDALRFHTSMIAVDCDRSWVEGKFREAVAVVADGDRPAASAECKWCEYVVRKSGSAGDAAEESRQS